MNEATPEMIAAADAIVEEFNFVIEGKSAVIVVPAVGKFMHGIVKGAPTKQAQLECVAYLIAMLNISARELGWDKRTIAGACEMFYSRMVELEKSQGDNKKPH